MDNIIGGRALRNFSRGYQIGALDVCLVCKGDEVAIIAQSEAMTIKTSGTAIESGAMGETIQVKNNSSNRIIKGVIGELREIYVKL
jgi:flagella basal body P-ring formation protein FlgA